MGRRAFPLNTVTAVNKTKIFCLPNQGLRPFQRTAQTRDLTWFVGKGGPWVRVSVLGSRDSEILCSGQRRITCYQQVGVAVRTPLLKLTAAKDFWPAPQPDCRGVLFVVVGAFVAPPSLLIEPNFHANQFLALVDGVDREGAVADSR